MPRKRGAPPGNKNAYRHGFYSRQFKAAERRALDQATLSDLDGEIEFVRVYLRRFLEAHNALSAPLDFQTHLAVLRAVTLSAESINGMIRTQFVLGKLLKQSDDALAWLMQLPLDDPDEPPDPPPGE